MTNGIETQKALEKAVLEAITKDFTLDWSDGVDEVYKGFIRDLKADVVPELQMGETAEGRELFGIVWLVDDGDAAIVGSKEPLSEMLHQAVLNYGEEDALAALEVSLARFRAKQAKG